MVLVRVWTLLSIWHVATSKIYQRCDLAKELRNFDVPEEEIATWVCIARHESNYDSGAMNPGSGDHGLFQISQLYWCSPPGDGYGCNSPCDKFRDDDIADDLQCIRRIFREHKRISGNGFNAWAVYPHYCAQDNSKYVKDCPEEAESTSKPANSTENEIADEDGDGYQFPALPGPPRQSRVGNQLPFSKVSIHYSIPVATATFPKLPFTKQSIHHFIPAMPDISASSTLTPTTTEPSTSMAAVEDTSDSTTGMAKDEELEKHEATLPFPTSTPNEYAEPLLASSSITRSAKAPQRDLEESSSSSKAPLAARFVVDDQTTQNPKARQVTFAPDSFFSWLFNSQTLPPILPPARPARPPGERPPGLPRPSTMRPGGGRPGPDFVLTTRRPLPGRPHSQRRPGMGLHHRKRPLISSITPIHQLPAERSMRLANPAAVEVKLDDNFVFLRTMYLESVEGLDPDHSKHAMFVTLEPISGTPLQVAKRVQFNMLVRPVRNITCMETIANSLIPMFWIEESTTLPEKYQDIIKNKIYRTLLIVDIVRYIVLAVALAVIICCILLFIYAKWMHFLEKSSKRK